MKLPPQGTPERDFFVERMLTDTGFFCRSVLGMDTDRGDSGNAISEIGKGGIRDHGPHQEMIAFLDDEKMKYGVLMAPRRSYKSSAVEGLIMRKICAHPNISILLFMHEQDMAQERCVVIRDLLLSNPILAELYPDMRGAIWRKDRFVTGIRIDKTLQSPTLFVGSPQKVPTGGRADLVIFDDIVSDQNYQSELGRKKTVHCIEASFPIASPGCLFRDIGTPYHQGDAHHWVMEKPGWKKLVHLDVGFDIVKQQDGTMDVTGTGRWPHLTADDMREKLRAGMSFQKFMRDYKLQVVSGFGQAFHRTHFQPRSWQDSHSDLTGYLLCDAAPSGDPKNDLNAIWYVGIDHDQRLFLLDLEVGYWQMYEFCDRYLNMVQRWGGKVNHRAEVWEKGQNSYAYIQHLYVESKRRGYKPKPIYAQRHQGEPNKDTRIANLQVRFQSKQVFVMDTMPRRWNNGTEHRLLWDPQGFVEFDSGAKFPGGDLVEWFVQFPNVLKKDVPDALALVDTLDRDTGKRVCFWTKPSRQRIPEALERKLVQPGGRGVGSSSRFYAKLGRRSTAFPKRTHDQ